MTTEVREAARYVALAAMLSCAPRQASVPPERTLPVPIDPTVVVEAEVGDEAPMAATTVTPDLAIGGWERRLARYWLRTPAVASGRVYVGGGVRSRQMIALGARSGRELWRTTVGDVGPTSVLVHRGRVIFGTESCHLHSLDAETGAIEWERYLGDPLTAAPAAADGRVYAAHRFAAGWSLTALRLTDGEPVWMRSLSDNVLDAPVIADDAILVSLADGRVCSFARADGRRSWCREVGAVGAPTRVGSEIRVVSWPRGPEGQRHQLTLSVEGFEPSRASLFTYLLDRLNALGDCAWNRPTKITVTVERDGSAQADTGALPGEPDEEGSPRHCVDGLFADFATDPIDRRAEHTVELGRGEQEVVVLRASDGVVMRILGRRTLGRVPEMAARGGGYWLWHYEGPRVIAREDETIEAFGDVLRIRELESVLGADVLRWQHAEPSGVTVPVVVGDVVLFGTGSGDLVVRHRQSGVELSRSALGAPVASQPVVWGGWVYVSTADGRIIARDLRNVLPPGASYPMWGGSPTREG